VKKRWILLGVILLVVVLGALAGVAWFSYNAGRVSGAREAVAVMQGQQKAGGPQMVRPGPMPFGPRHFGQFNQRRPTTKARPQPLPFSPGRFGQFNPPAFFRYGPGRVGPFSLHAFFPVFLIGGILFLLFLGVIVLLLIAPLKMLFWRHSFGWSGPWGPPPGWAGPGGRGEPGSSEEKQG
jgi:hypothetical protein